MIQYVGIMMRPGLIRQGIERVLSGQAITCMDMTSPSRSNRLCACITDDLRNVAKVRHANVPVVLCADLQHRSEVTQALKQGAKACISIASSFAQLSIAIDEVCQGRTYLCPTLSDLMDHHDPTRDSVAITPREADVMHWLSIGYSSKQIGRVLGVSPHTVDTHRRSLMQKFGVHKAVELTRHAMARERSNPDVLN